MAGERTTARHGQPTSPPGCFETLHIHRRARHLATSPMYSKPPALPCKDAAAVSDVLFLGSLKAARSSAVAQHFDAVLNLSRRVVVPLPSCAAYCAVDMPDVADFTVVLPKLIYAVRWIVEQVVAWSRVQWPHPPSGGGGAVVLVGVPST